MQIEILLRVFIPSCLIGSISFACKVSKLASPREHIDQVAQMIMPEAALMSPTRMGVVFGAVFSVLIISAMTSMSGYRLTFVLPLENIFAALLVAFLTSQLAALSPILRASRKHILEIIQYK